MKRTMLRIGAPLVAGGFVLALKFNAPLAGVIMAGVGVICIIYGMSGKDDNIQY